jgi:hypothetical protein
MLSLIMLMVGFLKGSCSNVLAFCRTHSCRVMARTEFANILIFSPAL